MSRMILAVFALTIVSGCYGSIVPRQVSLVTARLETLGPRMSRKECDNCIPLRTCGCCYQPSWDYHVTEHAAQRCAFRVYSDYRRQCGQKLSQHFKSGFIAAFEDLALNRQPMPRVIPEPKYWNAFYRSPAGQPFVDEWFAGYDTGLEIGTNHGVARFHEVYIRRGGAPAAGAGSQCDDDQDDAFDQYDDGQSTQVNANQQMPLNPTQMNAYPSPPVAPGRAPNPYGR